MVKGLFDKKILELMYFLSTQQKFLNSKEIAQSLKSNGKSVTDRNVRRWLSFLKKQQYFWYYPNIRYEALGLKTVVVIANNVKDTAILDIIPHVISINLANNLNKFQKCVIATYAIAPENFNDFLKFWEAARINGLIESYYIHEFTNPFVLYSPIHKLVSEDGYVKINYHEPIDSNFVHSLEEKLNSKNAPELHSDISKNPFIVPIIFGYFRDFAFSKEVWYALKNKLGEKKLWARLSMMKRKMKRSDRSGIKFVQETIRYLHENFSDFFGQIRVYYEPLLYQNCEYFYLLIKLKDKNDLSTLLAEISGRSLLTTVCPPSKEGSNIVALLIQTTSKSMSYIFSHIISKYANPSFGGIIAFIDVEETYKYWGDLRKEGKVALKWNYHKLFDLDKRKWLYHSDRYMSQLKDLSKSMKKWH